MFRIWIVIPSEKNHSTGLSGGWGLKIKLVVLAVFFSLSSAFAGIANAQEGHPFKGTWRGIISMGNENQALLIIMDYDGESITGMINPGRSSYRFNDAELDASSWSLNAEATTRDGTDINFEGTLNEIGARNRYLEGTWTQAGSSYPFKITRE